MEGGDSSHAPARTARDPGLSIFVCYRREDSAGFARALKTVLGDRYGKDHVFMDLDNIEPGELWEDVVDRAVSNCDVLIALMGNRWLTLKDSSGQRRLENPLDPVRLEIETALRERLKVIPTLLQGAKVPHRDKLPTGLETLPAIQALAITDDWDAGVAKLVATLDRIDEDKWGNHAGVEPSPEADVAPLPPAVSLAPQPATAPPPAAPAAPASPASSPSSKPRRVSRSLVAGIVVAALVVGGILFIASQGGSGDAPSTDASRSTHAASDAALHDYLWNAYKLVQDSAAQRSQVSRAIVEGDGDALRGFQESRTELLNTVQAWDIPSEAKKANLALEQALHYSAISDGNWANVADGNLSRDVASSYDLETVHPAKQEFVRQYNELLAGVADAPKPLDPGFLF